MRVFPGPFKLEYVLRRFRELKDVYLKNVGIVFATQINSTTAQIRCPDHLVQAGEFFIIYGQPGYNGVHEAQSVTGGVSGLGGNINFYNPEVVDPPDPQGT